MVAFGCFFVCPEGDQRHPEKMPTEKFSPTPFYPLKNPSKTPRDAILNQERGCATKARFSAEVLAQCFTAWGAGEVMLAAI